MLSTCLHETVRFSDLVPSQHLQIFHYPDIDRFRQGFRQANVSIVPIASTDAPLGQAVLSLPGCDVYLLRTFPRIVHALLESRGAFVMFSMQDRLTATFNGEAVNRPSLGFARGPVEYRAVEKDPGYYAALAFSPQIQHRGWPEIHGEFLGIPVSRNFELRLRELIMRIFLNVSHNPDLTSPPYAGAGMTDALLEMLDWALDGYQSVQSPRREVLYDNLRALRAIDELVDSNSLSPIYSEDIALKLGVSVRTLTSLMVKTNGMSLHRYIRLRRLWTVRQQLLNGDPRRQIKEIALTNGFWHLSDFAAKYFSQFGELPSVTQSRC
jgi:AraC-like DNA-binding protein